MDYEELYLEMQTLEKDFKDKLAFAQKTLKSLSKNSEKGELKSLSKDLSQIEGFVKDVDDIVKEYEKLSEGFNAKQYMENGDFARQMINYCGEFQIDVKGDFPAYEMFPHKIKIDSENLELVIDRKRLQCVRPQYFVKSVKQSLDKLNKASFNASVFLNELAEAYDRLTAVKGKAEKVNKEGHDIHLVDIYNYLVPMQRFRREYDMQNFSFDISRLFASDLELTKDGRRFELGTSRAARKQIRILDRDGKERFFGTIRFF